MTKQFFAAAFLAVSFYYGQEGRVGVNTKLPKSTMDINGKTDASGISLSTDVTGLQAPRLTREELTSKALIYGADQKGALVYITDVLTGNADPDSPRKNVTSPGYYYFDGEFWIKIAPGNGVGSGSVTADNGLNTSATNNVQLGGALLKNTDVPLGDFNMTFSTGGTGKMGIATNLPSQKLDVDGNVRFRQVPKAGVVGVDGATVISEDTDKMMVLSSNGTAKLYNLPTTISNVINYEAPIPVPNDGIAGGTPAGTYTITPDMNLLLFNPNDYSRDVIVILPTKPSLGKTLIISNYYVTTDGSPNYGRLSITNAAGTVVIKGALGAPISAGVYPQNANVITYTYVGVIEGKETWISQQ